MLNNWADVFPPRAGANPPFLEKRVDPRPGARVRARAGPAGEPDRGRLLRPRQPDRFGRRARIVRAIQSAARQASGGDARPMRMKILYGVNGEGMRARDPLAGRDRRRCSTATTSASSPPAPRSRTCRTSLPRVKEIFGPSFAIEDGEIRRWATVRQNVRNARPRAARDGPQVWISTVREWRPDVVITDFEPLTGDLLAHHPDADDRASTTSTWSTAAFTTTKIIGGSASDYRIARAVTSAMVPGAVEYLVTDLLRRAARLQRHDPRAADPAPGGRRGEPERGDHLRRLLERRSAPDRGAADEPAMPCLVYGMRGGADGATESDGNARVPATLGRGLRRGPAHGARRRHRRRLLAAQRGGLPRQAGARDAAARASSSR